MPQKRGALETLFAPISTVNVYEWLLATRFLFNAPMKGTSQPPIFLTVRQYFSFCHDHITLFICQHCSERPH